MQYIVISNAIYCYIKCNILLYQMQYIIISNAIYCYIKCNILLYQMQHIVISNAIYCYIKCNIFRLPELTIANNYVYRLYYSLDITVYSMKLYMYAIKTMY